MENRDWITIFSVVIIVASWFVNSFLNRRHEILKKRMDYRLDALLSFLPIIFAINENRTEDEKFSNDIASSWTKFQLYCYKEETEEFEKIMLAIKNKDTKDYAESVRRVAKIVRENVRKELGLDKFEYVHKQ
ncbi:MAG: hypothetical protein LHV68_09715 [Elusimicrobia bacterium]|nr:hypothetical protein [Candidatus Liberimonas magnetica]